jgi:glycosyltransferase involved in cell wall biosynthesis
MGMKITVIIPTYNRVEMLGRAIQSLLRQRHDVDLDILVIDDASTDGTAELLVTLSATHPAVRVLRQNTNTGPSMARNQGLAALLSDTEVVTFLDSDDLSPPGRFAADLPVLVSDPSVDLTYGKMMLVDAIDPHTLAPPVGARQLELMGIHLSAGLYRRSLIERIGTIDVGLKQAEDTDYLLRIFESDARFAETTTLCLYYLRHGANTTNDNAVARRWFAAALLRSMQRRKRDPGIVLRTPTFMVQPLSDQEFV